MQMPLELLTGLSAISGLEGGASGRLFGPFKLRFGRFSVHVPDDFSEKSNICLNPLKAP